MPSATTTLHQGEILGEPRSAVVRNYSLGALAEMEADFRAAVPQGPPFAVGVSIGLAQVGPRIQTLALATRDRVFCLTLQKSLSSAQIKTLRNIFSNILYLIGFEFPYTIVLLAHMLGSDVSGYDLSTLSMASKRGDITTPGDFLNLKDPSASARRINQRWDGDILRTDTNSACPKPNYALRAWFTTIAGNMALPDLQRSQQLTTRFLGIPMLIRNVDLASRSIRLDILKPRIQENDFTEVKTKPDGTLNVHNARYKSRIRGSSQTYLEVHLKNGDVVTATIKGVKGRRSSAVPDRPLESAVNCIRVIGRIERTNAERAQYFFLHSSLIAARHTPLFVNIIWPQSTQRSKVHRNEQFDLSSKYAHKIPKKLNNSQREIVSAMLSTAPQDSLIIAHGPPGTGKTSTIAAAAEIWVSYNIPCWIIAQSNVAVKNIAETLFRKNVRYKLIVSQEFLFEWHEDLYTEIEDMVIRSDGLPQTPKEVSIKFDATTLVLCTHSMLSHPRLEQSRLLDIIPMRTLVIDEASQIDVFEFMHLFYKFSHVLKKVCFFGDPKQLPPYGAEEAGLETIFDVEHLKMKSYFLDTQYRLPIPLGEFISEKVYDGKLQSCHEIVDYSCVAFIDVRKGRETRRGSSYQNMEEVHMVVRIARRYHKRRLDFCIITFYDPQRSAITKALEAANLPSERVYNVDSFQGNEADYVILSTVRTQRPGFLTSQPRINVALTRCRKGMVVVTNKRFLHERGKNTLLAQLCHAWLQHCDAWVDWKVMLSNESVALPGLPSPHASIRGSAVPAGAFMSQRPPAPTISTNNRLARILQLNNEGRRR